MKLNNLVNDDEKDINYIKELYQLILIKYKNCFNNKEAYELAEILYENGIRYNMFFEEKYDIDEIIYYVYRNKLNKNKIIKFPKCNQSFDFNEEDFNKRPKIFKFNKNIRK